MPLFCPAFGGTPCEVQKDVVKTLKKRLARALLVAWDEHASADWQALPCGGCGFTPGCVAALTCNLLFGKLRNSKQINSSKLVSGSHQEELHLVVAASPGLRGLVDGSGMQFVFRKAQEF